MSGTGDLVAARGATHGNWRQQSGCAAAIKTAMSIWRTNVFAPEQQEALDAIAVKMARICCGDPNHPDHWDVIAGYAILGKSRASADGKPKPKTPGDTVLDYIDSDRCCGSYADPLPW